MNKARLEALGRSKFRYGRRNHIENKSFIITTLAIIIWVSAGFCAEDTGPKGVEVVPDTAVTLLQKLNAYFTGKLTWTVPADKPNYKNDYTVDVMGRKIPDSTLGKYDDGVR